MKSNKIETLLNEVHSKILVPKQTRLSTPANGIAPQVYLFVIYFLANIHVNLTKKTRFVKIRQFFKNWFHEKTFFNRNKMLFISSKIPEVIFVLFPFNRSSTQLQFMGKQSTNVQEIHWDWNAKSTEFHHHLSSGTKWVRELTFAL